MSRFSVIVSTAARDDVMAAVEYIEANSSLTAALDWLAGLEAVFRSLKEMPERFGVAREDRYFPHGTLRRAIHHNHRILYTIEGDTVRVLHVRHGGQDDLIDF